MYKDKGKVPTGKKEGKMSPGIIICKQGKAVHRRSAEVVSGSCSSPSAFLPNAVICLAKSVRTAEPQQAPGPDVGRVRLGWPLICGAAVTKKVLQKHTTVLRRAKEAGLDGVKFHICSANAYYDVGGH